MELEFTDAKWSMDDKGTWLSVCCKDHKEVRRFVAEKQDKLYIADLKLKRNKRSLDANSYFWVLCGKLAAILKIPKTEIYRSYIQDIGDNFVTFDLPSVDVEKHKVSWEKDHKGRILEVLGQSEKDGYTSVICFYGSSDYNTKQMSCLIDMVVQDCKDQDIETATPDQIALMKARWADMKGE